MKATDLLTKQHHTVARLFKAIEAAQTNDDKEKLFKELASNLAAHDGIERQIFYPACKEVMGLNDELGEALAEHGVIEFSLYQANEALGTYAFTFKCKVLKEMVEHHVKEEEEEFFPKAEKALSESQLEALGDEMAEAFEDALGEDFQTPLYESLRQVMAGVLEPTPKEAKKGQQDSEVGLSPMRLQAGCEINLSAPSPAPLIAMLRPRSGAAQWIISETYDFKPFVQAVEYVDSFGNLCQRLTAPAGAFRIHTEVVMEVSESIATDPGGPLTPLEEVPDYALQFLLPSRYCPSDTLQSLANEIVQGKRPGYDQVEAIRAFIRKHIEYKSGASDGSTSAAETLRDKAGVCRDFSHVGLSLCRALRIPARMVVGYLLGLKPMDLHAWFEAFVGGRWYAFDATQPEPRGGRIPIAYGRDAADVALITEFGPLKTENLKVWVRKP